MKTNAIRLLKRERIPYRVHEFPVGEDHIDAVTVAAALGVAPERVFKTLVCADENAEHSVFVIPAPCDLDLKKAAIAMRAKRIRLIPVAQIETVTGYVRGGCSPLGMKKSFPTFFEESAGLFETIYVSAGVRGIQLEIDPDLLIKAVNASYEDLI